MPCRVHPRFCFEECTRHGQDCTHITPKKYASDDLVAGFEAVFKRKAPKQRRAIEKWKLLTQGIRGDRADDLSKLNTEFGDKELFDYFATFDDFFFRGALRHWTSIKFVKFVESHGPGYIALGQACCSDKKKGTVLIKIVKPEKDWTKAIFQRMMGTLLHEMAHAVFLVFRCTASWCSSLSSKANHEGISGHGPSWRRLGQAMQRQAQKSFPTVEGSWHLDVYGWGYSHRDELESVFDSLARHDLTRSELPLIKDAMFHKDL